MVRVLSVSTLGLLALLCLFSSEPVQAGKVLVVPVDGSHWLSMKILVEELSQRGHEMVVLVPKTSVLIRVSGNYPTKSFHLPYTLAELDANMEHIKNNLFEKLLQVTVIFANLGDLMQFTYLQVKACEGLLYNEPLMKSLRETGFDVLLTDPFLPRGSCPLSLTSIFLFLCHKLFARVDELASRYLQKDTAEDGADWLLMNDFTFEYPKTRIYKKGGVVRMYVKLTSERCLSDV
uniref:Uncharacterized protein n=1 Tax=Sinocyclocheilus anshuiensis TaxID=1608454 RepID=A0A671NT49_9TELE